MFNPFRRKKTLPVVWLWGVTGAAVLVGVAAWVVVNAQWRLANGLQAKYDAAMRQNAVLAQQLHDMKQYEGTDVGSVVPSCGTLAQIGAFAGEPATAAGAVLEALRKRDPAITAADVGQIVSSFYATASFQTDDSAGVSGIAVRLADGGLSWLDGSTVRRGGLYEVRLTADYLNRHLDNLCRDTVDRPELTTCIPDYVTLMNHGVYIGDFIPGCEAQTVPDAAMNQ